MKKTIEIVEIKNKNVELTKEEILLMLREVNGTYDFISSYTVSEEFILENIEYFDLDIVIRDIPLSESFIRTCIKDDNLSKDQIKDLCMSTYANLSKEFIEEYKEFINYNRMICYLTTQSDSFDEYINIIEENNLWGFISANDLPVEFIREWKDKLDWRLLSIVKKFTLEEDIEFSNYIILPNREYEVTEISLDSIKSPEWIYSEISKICGIPSSMFDDKRI